MKKLSNDRLHELKGIANKEGKKSYEVMSNEELAAYKNNCLESIETRKDMIAIRPGTLLAKIAQENVEWMEEALVYIDSKLSEKVNPIDQFLANWKEKAFTHYMNLRKEYENLMSEKIEITPENLELLTDAWGRRKLTDEKIEKLMGKVGSMAIFELNNWETSIRSAKIKEFKSGITKNELMVIDSLYRPDKAESILNDILDHQVKQRKLLLIGRITKKAGNIIDASGLYIAANQEINGTVIGDKETVNVTTVLSGGYNVQCLHYRVLVK